MHPDAGKYAVPGILLGSLVLGTVSLIIATIASSTLFGRFPAGSLQLWIFVGFTTIWVWLLGLLFKRNPRWWIYAAAVGLAVVANASGFIRIA